MHISVKFVVMVVIKVTQLSWANFKPFKLFRASLCLIFFSFLMAIFNDFIPSVLNILRRTNYDFIPNVLNILTHTNYVSHMPMDKNRNLLI